MFKSKSGRVMCSVLCLAVLGSGAAYAQVESEISSRGFQADKVYDAQDIDVVNLFNGNLTLTIPIGNRYPVSESFSYGFVLTYNSYVWDQQYIELDGDPNQGYSSAVPTPISNAGLGWTLTLGALFPPYTFPINDSARFLYVSADGSRHGFADTLHNSDTLPGGQDPDPGVWYTRDNSYLRLKELATGEMIVEHGDGTTHTFQDFGAGDWRLVSIRDQHDNELTVEYLGDDWLIEDSHGRQHRVYFQTFPNSDLATPQVASVVLEAFGGGSATYDFAYYADQTIDRGCRDTVPADPDYEPLVTVPFLQRVTLPEGANYLVPTVSDYTTSCPADEASGTLKRLRLPTRGEIAWDYQTYWMPGTCAGGPMNPPIQIGPSGVASRTTYDRDGELLGTWHYDNTLAPAGPYRCNVPGLPDFLPDKTTTVVVSPDGSCIESFFSARAGSGLYGLPVDVDVPYNDNPANQNLALSSRIWTEHFQTRAPETPWNLQFHCSGAHLRSEFGEWVDDNGTGGRSGLNRRTLRSRTRFEDDPWEHDNVPRYREAKHSDFDGLGHYRHTQRTKTWLQATVSEVTDFNPDRGTYGQPGYQMLPASEPWVLDTYSRVDRDGGHPEWRSASEACFGAAGLLERQRDFKEALRGSDDRLTLFTYDPAGNLVREEYYGADLVPLSIGGSYARLCDAPLPTEAPQYVIVHEYEHGTRRRSYYEKENGLPMPFNTLEVEIDRATGLARSSYDVSKIRTDFHYDAQGRLTSSRPEPDQGAEITYEYKKATASQPARVFVRTYPNAGGDQLSRTDYHYDGFGRLRERVRTLPGGLKAHRKTRYSARGWLIAESSWSFGAPSLFATEYSGHDPFGRPQTVQAPDGTTTTLAYTGDRLITRSQNVAGHGTAVTVEHYNAMGQLRGVRQSVGPQGGEATAWYDYDERGRLARVDWENAPAVQHREWNYDGIGQLRSKQVPELGFLQFAWAGNYDARGNPQFVNGPLQATVFVGGQWLTYDRAERLVAVHELQGTATDPENGVIDPVQGPVLKEWVYGASNAGPGGENRRLGKVQSSHRHNREPGQPVIEVAQEFFYRGLGGRVSTRRTSADGKTFTTKFSWNELGQPLTLEYPTCSGCPGSNPPSRVVAHEYTQGWLTEIPGHVSNITYQANGLLAGATHSNGAVDTWAPDPFEMARPYRIFTQSNGQTVFDTGLYAFDAAGNVAAMGSDQFGYDGAQRIVSASAGGLETQSYTYNHFGCLSRIRTNGSDVNWGCNSADNHWATTYRGNVTEISDPQGGNVTAFAYDALDKLVSTRDEYGPPGEEREVRYLYDADDERVARIERFLHDWNLRDLDHRMIRTYRYQLIIGVGWVWSWKNDFIYRGNTLNSVAGAQLTHVHVDHLGSTRLKTDSLGDVVEGAVYTYFPFGEGVAPSEQPAFTGHERNVGDGGEGQPQRALDYMHARHYLGRAGRFLQRDPVDSSDPAAPQSWNQFTYALNNPLKWVDPDGRQPDSWSALIRSTPLPSGPSKNATIHAVTVIGGLGPFLETGAGVFVELADGKTTDVGLTLLARASVSRTDFGGTIDLFGDTKEISMGYGVVYERLAADSPRTSMSAAANAGVFSVETGPDGSEVQLSDPGVEVELSSRLGVRTTKTFFIRQYNDIKKRVVQILDRLTPGHR